MTRIKERKKIIHQSDTKEYFLSISSMPKWCEILIANIDKPYNEFVSFLLSKNFYNDNYERIVIKNIATDAGIETSKISKWLPQIYEDIIELNNEQPELFSSNGIRHEICCRRHDSYCNVNVWLLCTPRLYESFEFDFASSRTGSRYYYVEKVSHTMYNNEHIISIELHDGFVNKYRELLVDRAELYGIIDIQDRYQKLDFQIDTEIAKYYKY